MSEGVLANEEAAERKTNISGWVCKTCRRFYGDEEGAERAARYCCEKDHACGTEGCSGRAGKPWIYCDPCLAKRDLERWLKLPEVVWDGNSPLVIFDDDTYFYDVDSLRDYLDENNLKIEDIRLVIAETDKPPKFDVEEFLIDYLGEEGEVDGAEELNKHVNEFIDNNAAEMWVAGSTRPTKDSLGLEVELNSDENPASHEGS